MSSVEKRRWVFSQLTWLVPVSALLVIVLALSVSKTGASFQTIRERLAAESGVSATALERISLRIPGGWNLPLVSLLQIAPHAHLEPPSFSIIDTGVGMVFAHLGNGIIPGTDRFLQTTFLLFNDTNQGASGTIEFYDDDGNALELALDDGTASEVPFTLNVGEIKRFSTTGAGEVVAGWAHVHSSQPISGTASFGVRDDSGTVFTDVGVAAASLGAEFTVFADSIGDSNSGVAAANPSASIYSALSNCA